MYFSDHDDIFDEQLKEHLVKKQKKLEKQERLKRKKILLEEIKNKMEDNVQNEFANEEKEEKNAPRTPKKCSLEWAKSTLNIKNEMSIIEIKKIYLKLAQQYHPDKNNGENKQEMKDLNEAWEIIKTRYR